MKPHLRISVRGLVEHCLRSGDLNLESWGSSSPVDAIRAHQKVQASRGEGYAKEVSLTHVVENEHFVLEIGGRIDGVLTSASPIVIEEIKTTAGDVDVLASREEATHWGQLQVYAYIYALQNDLDAVVGRLTYYQLDSGQTRELERHFSLTELGEIVDRLVERYLQWAKRIDDWRCRRNASIGATAFPFPAYRPGQREMAVQVYWAIREQSRLLVRAPTGIGKTQATAFPAIKALGEDRLDKIFYLTARTTGRGLAEQALGELRDRGLRLKSVTLTAKDKICFNPDKACTADECEFARGFYARIDAAVEELFVRDDFSREGIESIARSHRVCPFELSLELALWADVIVCDYNYVFDPRTYLRRFFDDDGDRYAFLIDEAHNLVDRARDMYSAELRKQDVLKVRRVVALGGKTRHRALHRSLGSINRAFLDARERCDERSAESEPPEAFYTPLRNFLRDAESFLAAGRERGREAHRAVLDLFFDVSRFLRVSERYDERYVTCYQSQGRDVRVKLFCTDPANELSETLDKGISTVFFSATLSPMDYFRTTLGCGEDAASYVLPSPFPPEHLRVLVHDRIATTYKKRETTRAQLSRLLTTFVEQKQGNYLLYFPSYEYMEAVAGELDVDAETLVQRRDMDENERRGFLERFAVDGCGTLVGLAVLGGFFGEGIDLVGERLTGAAIVGVGLPGLSPERDQIRDRFDQTAGSGFDYAYVFPGMNRVLQAAGRVIRSESDRGTMLLVDERFARASYRSLLPPEWRPCTVSNEREIAASLREFWSQTVPAQV